MGQYKQFSSYRKNYFFVFCSTLYLGRKSDIAREQEDISLQLATVLFFFFPNRFFLLKMKYLKMEN